MEVVGLVIGGVSLLTMFESGMNAFDHIETAKHYGGEYEKYSLKLALLHLRLGRWAKGVELASAVQAIGTPDEGEQAKELLAHILSEIQRTEAIAKRYNLKDKGTPPKTESDDKVDFIDSLVTKVSSLAIKRQKKSSITQKTRWALRDQSKFQKLLVDIDNDIKDLEDLFPTVVQTQVQELASVEAQELIGPSSVTETDDSSADATTRMALLAEGTEGIDNLLKSALEQTAPSRDKRVFSGNFLNSDEAKVFIGTYVAPGNTASKAAADDEWNGNFWNKDKAKVHIGNKLGGTYVLD